MNTLEMTSIGERLSRWRRFRRFSQLDLALEADVSQRHLSFMETGRSAPSREMLLHLAEHLRVPFRERNAWLVAAGYAPVFADQGALASKAVYGTIQTILSAQAPFPALAVDRHWNLVLANKAAMGLLRDVHASLLEEPINVLRVSLHPGGLASRILNYREWRSHIVARIARQIEMSGDDALAALLVELKAYPLPPEGKPPHQSVLGEGSIAVPLRLASPRGVMSLISTTTVFGSTNDITLSELTIETFFPADDSTAELLRAGD